MDGALRHTRGTEKQPTPHHGTWEMLYMMLYVCPMYIRRACVMFTYVKRKKANWERTVSRGEALDDEKASIHSMRNMHILSLQSKAAGQQGNE